MVNLIKLGPLLIAGALALTPGAALADDLSGSAGVSAGSLSMAAADPPSLAATLNGTDQQVSDAVAVDAKDNRGSGSGWKLQITSTQFTTGGGTPRTLGTSSLRVSGVTSACDAGTCTTPTNAVSYPHTVPAAATAPTATTMYSSAVDTGMGDFTLTPTFQLTVPANTYAGTYSSTITVTQATGPS